MPPVAEFWFALASTYSYPAAMRAEALARAASGGSKALRSAILEKPDHGSRGFRGCGGIQAPDAAQLVDSRLPGIREIRGHPPCRTPRSWRCTPGNDSLEARDVTRERAWSG
jgi:hypothetical protein